MIRDNDFSTIRSRTYDRFDYSTSRLLLKRFKQNSLYMIIIAFMLSVGVSLAVFQPGIGYEILVNGEHIGFTKNPKDIMQTLSSLDKDLRVTKGEDIKYDMDVKFVKGKLDGNKLVNADDLKIMVSSMLSIKKPAFILKTDDGIAFAIDSKESMDSILEGVKVPYLEGKRDAEAEIVSNISLIESKNVPVDKILNYSQAMSYITLSNATSEKPTFDVKVSYTATSEKPIKRGVTTIGDSSMYEGESVIQSSGSDGVKSVESRVTEINGNVISSNVLSEKVLQEPKPKVIKVGTKPKVAPVLKIAYNYLGVPYVWGGTTPRGFDCSGFVQYVYAQRGIYLPRTTYEQVNVGRRVSRSQLQPGDLCHFPGHVGIYIGDGMMIHAPKPGDVVSVASIDVRNFLFGTRVE
ncbi:MAG: C40 family peptidase [Peptoanaerobacter stomatis]|uniref:C40 family peptidase n=1 Tax=Peptoanaerobacter stomatis TaxID=796937 RepID=UPI003FA02CBB